MIATSVLFRDLSACIVVDDDGIVVLMEGGDERAERRLVEEASKLRVELAGVEVRLTDRIAQSEGTLRQDIHTLDVRMEREMGALRADVGATRSETLKWSFAFWIGQVITLTAIMNALLR